MEPVDFGQVIGLVAVILMFSIPVVSVICHYGQQTVKAWLAMSLKRDMVARGYTAQEIVDVVSAEPGSRLKSTGPDVPPTKPIKQPQYN